MAKLFEGARKNWKFVISFIVISIIFWLLEFSYQFYVFAPGELGLGLVRSFGFSAATFFGLALLSSSIFKWKPALAKYWDVRRNLGVMGFVFLSFHFRTVLIVVLNEDLSQIVGSLNPFENPLFFGLMGLIVFFLMAITSFDWAVAKLGANWKKLHRLVYFGYWAGVSHFLLVNPPALMNPAGYLLIAITFLALAGQLFWFIKTAGKFNFKTRGTLIGILVIFLYLITLYFGYLV